MDKLRAITCFCRSVEAKSFAAAAQALGVVPSALSKTIAALESDLGFRLLNRSTRRLSLTVEGESYYEHCRVLLRGLEEAESASRAGQTTPKGNLRIGMHPGLRVAVLGHLGPFMQQNAGLTIETVVTNSAAAVVEDGLDVVLRIGQLADCDLVAREVAKVQSIACAAPGYLDRHGEPRHPRDLGGHRAIVYGRRDEASNANWVFVRRDERVLVSVPVGVMLRDGIGVVDAAVGGCGIALPFDTSVRHLLASRQLRALLPGWFGEQRPVLAITSSNRGRTPAKVRAFIEFVEATLRGGRLPS